MLYFDDNRKWRERFVVVRADHSLELHDSQEVKSYLWSFSHKGTFSDRTFSWFCYISHIQSYTKGTPARHKLLPTGGTVLTSDEKYTAVIDKAFTDPNGECLSSSPFWSLSSRWNECLCVVQVLRMSPPFLWWRFPVHFLCTWDCLTDETRTSVSSRRRSGPASSRSWTTAFGIRTKVSDQHCFCLRVQFWLCVCGLWSDLEIIPQGERFLFAQFESTYWICSDYFSVHLPKSNPKRMLYYSSEADERIPQAVCGSICSSISLLLFFCGGHGDTLIISRIATLSSCALAA